MQAFANSVDPRGRDELESPQALAGWLAARGLLPAGVELTERDIETARRVRAGFRAVVAARRRAAPREAREALEEVLWPVVLRVRFPASGGLRLEPAGDGLDGAFGRLLAIALEAQLEGRFARLGICAVEDCRTVFYDRSTNRHGRFCRVQCGNRVHAVAFRRREKRRGHPTY